MADLDLDGIDALAAAATPGPWNLRTPWTVEGKHPDSKVIDLGTFVWDHDAALIAATRDAVTALTARVRELEAAAAQVDPDEVIEVSFDPDLVVAWDGSNPMKAREQATRYRKQRDNAVERGDRMKEQRDEARAEVARLRAQVDAVTALCDEWERRTDPYMAARLRAALATGGES